MGGYGANSVHGHAGRTPPLYAGGGRKIGGGDETSGIWAVIRSLWTRDAISAHVAPALAQNGSATTPDPDRRRHPLQRGRGRGRRWIPPGARTADIGTGCGILTIATLLLGASHVFGFDILHGSVQRARENLALNGLTNSVSLACRGVDPAPTGSSISSSPTCCRPCLVPPRQHSHGSCAHRGSW